MNTARDKGLTGSPRGGVHPSLESFMTQLAEIAPGKPISPESDLIDDLGFDALDFGRLAVMLFERYGMAGLSSASMRSEESLTVEGFFRNCVLDVLRCGAGES